MLLPHSVRQFAGLLLAETCDRGDPGSRCGAHGCAQPQCWRWLPLQPPRVSLLCYLSASLGSVRGGLFVRYSCVSCAQLPATRTWAGRTSIAGRAGPLMPPRLAGGRLQGSHLSSRGRQLQTLRLWSTLHGWTQALQQQGLPATAGRGAAEAQVPSGAQSAASHLATLGAAANPPAAEGHAAAELPELPVSAAAQAAVQRPAAPPAALPAGGQGDKAASEARSAHPGSPPVLTLPALLNLAKPPDAALAPLRAGQAHTAHSLLSRPHSFRVPLQLAPLLAPCPLPC